MAGAWGRNRSLGMAVLAVNRRSTGTRPVAAGVGTAQTGPSPSLALWACGLVQDCQRCGNIIGRAGFASNSGANRRRDEAPGNRLASRARPAPELAANGRACARAG